MTEQQLRALVREALTRYVNNQTDVPRPPAPAAGASPLRVHPSHGLYMIPDGGADDGPCVIEPSVPCNHCGYCKSHGH